MDPQALDLATKTLAAAIDSLMAKGAPLSPLVFVQKEGQRIPRRVTAAKGEQLAVAAKRIAAGEEGADVTAYAVSGTIQYDGGSSAGVVVEAWNFHTGRGARIGLRYELKGTIRKKPSLIGSPLHLGSGGWYDPEAGEPAAVPTFPEAARVDPVAAGPVAPPPTAAPDFGPPPTTPPVMGFPPPASAAPPPPAAPPPVQQFAPPLAVPPTAEVPPAAAAHPVEAPSAPVAAAYTPVPIQRNETPLGNRAMFAGIMELATRGRSFPAFAIVQKGGAWEQVTMTDASLADAAASVRAYARTRTDADFIAFAIDAVVLVDDAPVPAVIVEVWEYATRVSFSVAQRYSRIGEPPSPRLSGRPLMRTQTGWVDVPSSMTLGGQVQFAYRDPDPV